MKPLNKYLTKIQESKFVAIPGMDKDIEELTLGGNIIYTSNTLRENIKKAFKKYFPKLSKKVSELIDNKTLTPAFRTKSIIQYLMRKKRKDTIGTAIGDKIYIFIEPHYAKFKIASVDEKQLSLTILHELMHLVEHIKLIPFMKINYKLIVEFYKEFFKEYLVIKGDIETSIIDGILMRQKNMQRKGIINFHKMYSPVFDKLQHISSLSDEEKLERYNDFIDYLDEDYEQFTKFVPGEMFDAGKKAYVKIAGGETKTLAQEFWSLSEILSVISTINPNHINVRKTLDTL